MPLISTTGKASIKNAKFAQEAHYAAIKGQDLKQASFEQALVLYGTPRRKILPGTTIDNVFTDKILSTPASNATTHYGLNSTYYTTSTSNLNFAGSIWDGYADDERVTTVKMYVAGSNVIGNGTTLKDAPYSNTGTILSKFYTPSSTQGKLIQYALNSSGVVTGSVEIDDNYYYGATPWTVADVIFQQDFESESGYNGNLSSFSNLVSSPAIPVTSGLGWLPVNKIVKGTGKAITLRGSETASISVDISGAWTLEFSMKVDSVEDSLYNTFYTENILSILNAQNQGIFLEAFNRNANENNYNQNYNNRDIGYRFRSTASSYRSFHVDLSYWRNIAITCSANKIASGTDGSYRQVRIFVDGRELAMSGSTYTDILDYDPFGGGGGGGYIAYPGELGFKGNLTGINFGAANAVNFCVDNIRLSKSQKPYANYTPSLPFARPAGAPSVASESYPSGVVYQQNFNSIAADTNLSNSWASELGAPNISAAAGWQVINSPFESGKVAVMKNWVSTNGNILVGPQTNNFTFEISMRVTDYPVGDINYSTGYQSFEYLKIGGLLIYYYRTFCRHGINCGTTADQYFLTLGGKWINLYPKYDATFQGSSVWTHLAVSCRPNNIKVFSNGKLLGQFHATLSAQAIQLPMAANSSVFAADSVYIDNIRLSNFARYEEDYTPSFPFPSS